MPSHNKIAPLLHARSTTPTTDNSSYYTNSIVVPESNNTSTSETSETPKPLPWWVLPEPKAGASPQQLWTDGMENDRRIIVAANVQRDLPQSYTESELTSLAKGRALFNNFQAMKRQVMRTELNQLVKGEVSTSGETVSAKASATIRAPVKSVLGFIMYNHIHYWNVLDGEDKDIICTHILEPINAHHIIGSGE
jgi:hypothetical protein